MYYPDRDAAPLPSLEYHEIEASCPESSTADEEMRREAIDAPAITAELPEDSQEERDEHFTIIEFGAGRMPLLTNPHAPDIVQLYSEGGRYIGIDPDKEDLAAGEKFSDYYIERYAQAGQSVDTAFMHAEIGQGGTLPALLALEAGSAGRVVLSNIFTDPRINDNPALCDSLAHAALQAIRDSGEIVVIGTYTPGFFSKDRIVRLFEAVGCARAGSDDVRLYYPQNWRRAIDSEAYAERFRRGSRDTI